jgi:chromate transport protein ChrA
MDGSAIGNVLPVFGILVAAFGVVIQTLIPTVSEEGTSPMRTLLLSHIFFLFLPAHLFFISPLLILVFMLLVALFFLLTLPFIEENTRSHSGLEDSPTSI